MKNILLCFIVLCICSCSKNDDTPISDVFLSGTWFASTQVYYGDYDYMEYTWTFSDGHFELTQVEYKPTGVDSAYVSWRETKTGTAWVKDGWLYYKVSGLTKKVYFKVNEQDKYVIDHITYQRVG